MENDFVNIAYRIQGLNENSDFVTFKNNYFDVMTFDVMKNNI